MLDNLGRDGRVRTVADGQVLRRDGGLGADVRGGLHYLTRFLRETGPLFRRRSGTGRQIRYDEVDIDDDGDPLRNERIYRCVTTHGRNRYFELMPNERGLLTQYAQE